MQTPSVRSFSVAAGLAALALLATAPAARADVIVIDPHGGPGAQLLQDALDTAHDGDILLLKAGDYTAGLPSDQKIYIGCPAWVSILPDVDAGEVVIQAIANCGYAPTPGTTLLRGLRIEPVAGHDYDWGWVHGSLAPPPQSWVEDCTLVGQDVFRSSKGLYEGGSSGIGIAGRVVVTHCTIAGGNGCDADPAATYFKEPSYGMEAVYLDTECSAILADCNVKGGHAGNGAYMSSATTGGFGVFVYFGGTGWISGSEVLGGDTGAGNPPTSTSGSGVEAYVSSVVMLRDSTVAAGLVVDQGIAGPDIQAPAGVVQWMPAAARSCHAPSPVRAWQEIALSLSGMPGDAVLLLVSTASDAWPRPGLQGSLAVDAAVCFILPPIVLVDPDGQQDVTFRMPEVPAEFGGGVALFVQGVFAGEDGLTLGAPTSVVWLGSGY